MALRLLVPAVLGGLLVGGSVLGGVLWAGSRKVDAATGLLEVGSMPADLSGVDQHGKLHQLAETRGQLTLVYFYPMDETPGCTKEACAFRDVWSKYEQAGVRLFGVSRDDQASHARFADRHQLAFPLIADPEEKWAEAFGVPRRFSRYARVSFLLGRDGRVAKVYPSVDPGVHASQVLGDASAL